MLFAVARLDSQMPSRQSMMGTNFVPVASTFVSAAFLGFVSSVSAQYSFGKYFYRCPGQIRLRIGRPRFVRRNGHFHHARVKVRDKNAVGLVILGLQPERVGLDP